MPHSASKSGGHSVSPTMTKKNPTSQREILHPPMIPRNAMGRQDSHDSGFITLWLKNQKGGAPLKIAPRTTTNKKKKGKNTTESLSVTVMVSPVTAPVAATSATTAVNTASTNGEATDPPSNSKWSRKHSGDASKILVLPTQIQHPNWLHASANTTIGKLNPSNQRWPVPAKKNWKTSTHN